MKKNLFLIALTICSTLAFAEDTKVRIDIVGDVQPSASKDYVYLIQADRYSADKDTSDIEKMMNGDKKVSVWAISPKLGNLSTMQTNVLKGTFIGFHANANTGYTMSFPEEWLSGKIVSIIDHSNKDTIIRAEAGTTYHFTVPTTKTDYTTRFEIGDVYEPLEPSICFRYGILQFTGHSGETVVVKNAAGAEVKNVTLSSSYQEIDMNGQPAGLYKVVMNDGEKEMFILVQ